MKKYVLYNGVFLLNMILTSGFVCQVLASEGFAQVQCLQSLSVEVTDLKGPTDDPPPRPAQAVAEWEPMTGVLITFPLQIPLNLVADMSHVVEVMTEVTGVAQARNALLAYAGAGADTAHCSFLITPYLGVYTRDHGPWYIFNGNNEEGMVATAYWPQIPNRLSDTLGVPVYEANFYSDGGNYMTDGMGTDFSTTYIYSGNPWMTQAEVNGEFLDYLGIARLITTPHPWGSFVPHIDTHAKLLDPGRLLVIQPSPTNTTLESNVQYWSTLISAYGRPYEIIRIPGTGYSNSLILNDHVFVSLTGNAVNDSTALAIFRQTLPGYTISGYTYSTFVTLDALHCRTHEMPDRYMLRIAHIPAFDQVNSLQGYMIKARIHRYSNTPFVNGTPVVKWKLQGSATFQTIAMTPFAVDSFSAIIPQQADNSLIQYYLHAEDAFGRSENHPYIGPDHPHDFRVLPANPLTVDLNPQGVPIVIPPGGGSFNFSLTVSNNSDSPLLFDLWSGANLPNGSDYLIFLRYNLTLPVGGSVTRNLTQTIPGSAPAGNYTYWVKVGLKPQGTIWGQDAFPFSKSGMVGSAVSENGWDLSGWEPTPIQNAATPQDYSLITNYPNPFNATTVIRYQLSALSRVSLKIYDTTGRLVVSLVEGWRQPGTHEATLDGSGLASGLYFARLTMSGSGATPTAGIQKLVLLK
jgi:agmatine deiminase